MGKKWTKEELSGRILVSCNAARDGLEPFIDRKQPFDSMSEACKYYCDLFFKKTENEGIMLNAKVIIPNEMRFDISFGNTGEKCGEMVVRVGEVV